MEQQPIEENRRILAVDDEVSVLEHYSALLTDHEDSLDSELMESFSMLLDDPDQQGGRDEEPPQEHFELTTLLSGEAGVAAVERALELGKPYFLVLLDMRMPGGIDGIEAAEQIRILDPTVYIIIITAYSDVYPSELHRRLRSGFLYFHKPFAQEELLQAIRNFQQAWRRDRELEQKHELERQLLLQQQKNTWLSGVREMNSAILHNVGNAMTSVEHESREVARIVATLVRLPEVLDHFESQLRETPPQELSALVQQQYADLREWIEGELVESLQQSSQQVTQVVDHIVQVMQASKSAGRAEELSVQTTLQALLGDVLLILDSFASNRKIDVALELPDTLPPLLWPVNVMTQVLVNLLKNAFEAIEMRAAASQEPLQGRVSIRAQCEGEQLHLLIEDNGIGVSESFRQQLFEFGHTSKEHGSGIGLNWVRRQLKGYQATIELYSPGSGKGATVTLRLPLQIEVSAGNGEGEV